MALNNLEKIFRKRSKNGDSKLKWNYKDQTETRKDEKLDEYNLNATTFEIATIQLEVVKTYLLQYKSIIKDFKTKKQRKQMTAFNLLS